MTLKRIIRTALVQMQVGTDLMKNLKNASKHIKQAKEEGAKLVVLPECFNSPYGTKYFKQYAEPVQKGFTCDMLSEAAKENSIYLVGGSFPELENKKYYNTCTVWNPQGRLIAKYRKIHLYDVDIPGKTTYSESDIFSPGNELTTFDMEGVKVGIGICYDLAFEELAKLYRLEGCKLLVYPAVFPLSVGPSHFEILQRARAVDNQLYVCAASSSRNEKGYIAYGYSQVTSPWGTVIAQGKEQEEIVFADIDFSYCDKLRENLPIFTQRRPDIYDTVRKS